MAARPPISKAASIEMSKQWKINTKKNWTELFEKTAKDLNVPISDVARIVQFVFDTTTELIYENENTEIKWDHIGKLHKKENAEQKHVTRITFLKNRKRTGKPTRHTPRVEPDEDIQDDY